MHERKEKRNKRKLIMGYDLGKKSRYLTFILLGWKILGISLFPVMFEFAFFSMLVRLGNAYNYEIWFLQVLVLSGYALGVYCTLHSRILKIISTIVTLTLAIFLLGFLITWCEALITLKIILSVIIAYCVLNLILSIRAKNTFVSKTNIKSIALILLIFSSCTGIVLIGSVVPRTIEINPKSEPELIFFCGSKHLPNETDVLEMCEKNNVGFIATIRRNMVGDNEYMQVYKNVIEHDVDLHFCIGGDDEFFAHIDNAEEFTSIYEDIRYWFVEEGIMDSKYIVSFSVDAEPPKEYDKNMNKEDLRTSLDYGVDNYPKREEIEEATKSMKEFVEAIKDDGKEAGMIRAAQLLDDSDGDSDLSLFQRNVYTLDVKWDYTITMLYRINELQKDETDDDPPQYILTLLSITYGAMIEGTKFTNSELNFYQNVELEQNAGDTNAKNQYIFIGNFDKNFKDTKYIKERQYKRDLDICRHFKEGKVFFYDLKGFLYHYGWQGIEELARHNKQRDKWYLKYYNGKSIVFYAFYCGLILVDTFAFFENDLT